MKKQEKSPEKELNEREASNLPGIEFKTMVIRMLKEHNGRINEINGNLTKEIENIKKDIETINKKNQS